MIEGGKSAEVVVVRGNFTGFERNLSGVAFKLVPVSDGARFPVHVIVDDDTAFPVVVTDQGFYEGRQFNSLKVDVTPSRGRTGDEWRLFIRPTLSDNKKQQFAADSRGRMLVVTPPAMTAWSVTLANAIKAWETINAKRSAPDAVYAYLSPTPATDGRSDVEWAVDDEEADRSHLTFSMGGLHGAVFHMAPRWNQMQEKVGAMTMAVELCATPTSRPFAVVSRANIWGGRIDSDFAPASIQLGEKESGTAGLGVRSTRWAPFMRFRFECATDQLIFADPNEQSAAVEVMLTLW